MAILEITQENYKEMVKENTKPVLMDLWAEWCMPCKMLIPIVEELAEEYGDKLVLAKVNVDQAAEIATELGVMNIPTLVFFKDGEEKGRVSGLTTKENIEKKLSEYCGI